MQNSDIDHNLTGFLEGAGASWLAAAGLPPKKLRISGGIVTTIPKTKRK